MDLLAERVDPVATVLLGGIGGVLEYLALDDFPKKKAYLKVNSSKPKSFQKKILIARKDLAHYHPILRDENIQPKE